MVESLMKAIAALGEKTEDLKHDIGIRDCHISKLEKELEEKNRELEELKKEFEEMKRAELARATIKRALED